MPDDYLKILEAAKKQYQQYVELGKLCDLLTNIKTRRTDGNRENANACEKRQKIVCPHNLSQ